MFLLPVLYMRLAVLVVLSQFLNTFFVSFSFRGRGHKFYHRRSISTRVQTPWWVLEHTVVSKCKTFVLYFTDKLLTVFL